MHEVLSASYLKMNFQYLQNMIIIYFNNNLLTQSLATTCYWSSQHFIFFQSNKYRNKVLCSVFYIVFKVSITKKIRIVPFFLNLSQTLIFFIFLSTMKPLRFITYHYYKFISTPMQELKNTFIPIQSLNCFNNKRSIFICANESCKHNAFMCNNEECDCIQSKHYGCNSHGTKYIVDSIQKQRRQITQSNKNTFAVVIQMYQELIEKISKQKEEFIQFIDMFGLGENMRKFVNLIRDGKMQQIVGGLVYQVNIEIKEQGEKIEKYTVDEKTVKNLWESKTKELDTILIKLKELRYDNKIQINSKIINYDGFMKIRAFMPKSCQKLQLLYRGSENNFSALKFHQKCDGVEDTVTLLETQFGKIIGGYTPISWQSPESGEYKEDPSGQSFLFSLSLNEKYKLMNYYNAIRNNKDFGPKFGGGRDLCLSNECNRNNESYAAFPTSYNNGKYQNNQAAKTAFSGQTNGYSFKVKQYEIFKVI